MRATAAASGRACLARQRRPSPASSGDGTPPEYGRTSRNAGVAASPWNYSLPRHGTYRSRPVSRFHDASCRDACQASPAVRASASHFFAAGKRCSRTRRRACSASSRATGRIHSDAPSPSLPPMTGGGSGRQVACKGDALGFLSHDIQATCTCSAISPSAASTSDALVGQARDGGSFLVTLESLPYFRGTLGSCDESHTEPEWIGLRGSSRGCADRATAVWFSAYAAGRLT